MKFSIRLLYLYLFSFIGLLIAVIGAVRLVELGLKVYVFHNADEYATYVTPVAPEVVGGKSASPSADQIEAQTKINQTEQTRQRQREVAGASAMILVGVPLYLYHWKTIQKESKKKSRS